MRDGVTCVLRHVAHPGGGAEDQGETGSGAAEASRRRVPGRADR